MSDMRGADERIRTEEQEEDEAGGLDEEDVLEVVEGDAEEDVPMDSDDDNDETNGGAQVIDDIDRMMDAQGLDDSIATFSAHAMATVPLKTTDAEDVEADRAVFCVAVHPVPESRLAVSGGGDERGRIWNVDDGKQVVELTGHEDSVTSVGWSADGELVATGGMDGRIRVWRRVKGADWSRWEFLTNLEGPDEVMWLEWHPRGSVLLAGSNDGNVWMFNLPSGQTMHVMSGHTAPVTVGKWSPDGKQVVTCTEDGQLILWDPKTGEAVRKLSATDARFRLEGGINALAINPAGTVALCGGAEGGIRAVNLTNATVLASLEGHESGASIEAIAYSEIPTISAQQNASVQVVVSIGTDGRVCTWDAQTFKIRNTGNHEDAATCLAFAPGTSFFVTGSADRTLKVWDYRRGTCEATFLGNRDIIHAVSISKDGQTIVSGAEDGLVKVFSTLHRPQ